MNLKKAFQYQRLIRTIQLEIVNEAMDDEKFEVVEENHKRSELNFYFNDANKTYSDELKVRKSKNVRGYDFARLLKVYEYLADCRVKLAQGISKVKDEMHIGAEGLSYDAAVLKASDLRDLVVQCEALGRKVEEEYNNTASLNFTQGTEKVQATYTITVTHRPDKDVVAKARAAYEKLKEEANDLSDAIEAAALTSRIPKEAEPAFPVTSDLDYVYKHLEEYVG